MKALMLIFLLHGSFIMAALAQAPAQTDEDQAKIIALENAWNLAESHKDVKALDQLLSEKLVYIDYDGSLMNKAQFLASVSAPSLHPEQIVNESAAVENFGDVAIVTGIYHEKGTSNGKAYLRRGRFTDTWVFENHIWQCVTSQSTLMSH